MKVAVIVVDSQAAEAQVVAEELARLLGDRDDHSGHPRSGTRPSLDPGNDFLEAVVAPAGQSPSGFLESGMDPALEWLEQAQFLVSGDGDGLTAEFPFGQRTALLRIDTADLAELTELVQVWGAESDRLLALAGPDPLCPRDEVVAAAIL